MGGGSSSRGGLDFNTSSEEAGGGGAAKVCQNVRGLFYSLITFLSGIVSECKKYAFFPSLASLVRNL